MKKPSHHVTFLSRILAHLAIICLVFNPIALSAQTLPITPDGSTATQVTHTSSGIDQINIAAPNSSGLSHNTFTDYNVNAAGQVINNFSGKDPSEVVEGTGGAGVALTSSNIAGLVAVNPNLSSSGSARIILNEVTSSNDSQLLGYAEIAGTKAELIIANPNGITCSGCGFINTSRLSMIAGKSEFDQNGNLGFNLEKPPSTDLQIPLITISGLGLDVESTSATDIIASSIKLISTIYGSETTDITLKTGSGKYDTTTKDLRLTTDDLPLAAQPLFALDATNLGAIQSGRIFIVATQDGFGVNLGKNLLATKSLNIDSAGNLYYENLTSPKINIKATSNITQSGNIITSGNLDITTTKTFTNFGILKSDTDINLTANSLENSFLINAKNITINTENFLNKNGGIIGSFSIQNEDGTTSQFNTERGEFVGKNFSNFGNVKARDLAFNISHLTNSGIIRSINDLRLTTVDLNNSGEISSQTNLNIEAAGNIGNTNKIFSNEALNISATKLTNSGDAAIASLASSLVFHLKTNLENNGELYSKKNLTIEVDELSNFGNIFSEENLTSNVYQLTNYGILQSIGDLQLTAFRLENYNSIKSFKTLTINAHASMNDALIFSAGNLTFNIPYLTNYGTIQSTDNLQLATTSLRNSGNIFANNDLDITSSSLENKADSTIASINKSLTLNLSDQLTNAGIIFAKENFSLKNSYTDLEISSVNNSGNISFDQLLADLKIKNFINSGTINSAQNLTITSSENFNNSGNILGLKDLTFNISHLTNSGILQSTNNLQLTTSILENSGSIKSFQTSTINADSITNQANALIFSADNLTISAKNSLTNSGSIFSNAKLDLTSGLATNNSEIFSVGDLKFTLTKDLNNTGSVNSLANLDIISSSSITNSNQILSSGNLTLSAGNLTNSNNIQSGGNLTLNLATLSNLKNIISGGDFNVTASGNISNFSTMQSANNFTINAANLTNSTSSLISSGKDLTIKAASIINKNTKPSNGIITSGLVAQNGNITLRTNFLNNDSGIIVAKNTDLNSLANDYSAVLSNILGKFFSTKSISLNLGNIDYTITGELSAQDIDITANNITNLGNVTANDFIKLNAIGSAAISNGNVTNGVAGGNNSNVKLSAGTYLTAIANRFISNYGTISANTDLTLTSNYSEIHNYGMITGGDGITILNSTNVNNGNFNNYSTAKLTANNNLIINAKDLNNSGEISVRNNLTTNISNNLNNNPTALIWGGHNATFNVANIFTNNQAEIYAEKNFTIQKNPNGEKTNHAQNISGNIETYSGNILINATTLENKRAADVVDKRVAMPNPTIGIGPDWVYQQSWCGGNYCGAWRHIYVANIAKNSNSRSGIIFSGNDLTINSNSFTNDLSELYSKKNMNIASNILNNTSLSTLVGRIVFVGGHGYSEIYKTTANRDDRWDYESYIFPKMTQKDLTTFPSLIKSGGFLIGTVYSQINNSTIAQHTAINSIAELSKSTTFTQLDRFTIIETGIINLDLSRIISAINSNSSQKSIQPQAIEFKVPSLITDPEQSPSDTIQQLPLQKISSEQISANNLSNSQIFDKINLGSLTINTTATLSANPLTPLIEARSKFTNIENYYGSDYLFIKMGLTKKQFFQQLEEEANKIRLEAEALRNAETKSSNQSTNESLINQLSQQLKQTQLTRMLGDSFTESKLLKEQLSSLRKDAMMLDEDGEGGEQEIKSLLDNTATELKKLNLTLAEVATKNLTQSQINSLEKDIITFESINLNGMNIIVPKIYLSLKTRERLGDRLGEGLNGSLATNSTIFAKGDLTLNSPTYSLGASLLNSGSIISGKDMMLNLASLTNKTISPTAPAAEIKSGNNLTITTIGDITNSNFSNITATNNLTLTSLNGDILNKFNLSAKNNLTLNAQNIKNLSTVETNDAALLNSSNGILGGGDSYQLRFGDSARSSGNITSNLISTASITAKNISINAENDFTNLAAKISSGEDLKITAGNDINIETLQLRNRTEERGGSKKKSWEKITDTTTNLASEISSSGNISLNSNADLNIVGSNVAAASDISLTSQNNTNILASQNTSFTSESSSKKGFSSSKSSGSGSSTLTNILANLTTENGDIMISSANNTNIIGAKLNGGSDATITSLGETNISSVTDQSSSYSYANKSSKGIMQKIPGTNLVTSYIGAADVWGLTRITDNLTGGGYSTLFGNEKQRVNTASSNQKIQTANLTSTNDITINSNENLNLQSANLKSTEGDILLTSNQNITITSAQEISSSSRTESGKTDRKSIKSNLEISEGKTVSSTLTAENITIASNNPPSPEGYGRTGDITLQAAKLKAEKDINLSAKTNIFLLASQDFSTTTETNKGETTAFAKSIGNKGGINSSVVNSEISAENQINLTANTIYAQHDAGNSFESTLQAKILNLKSETILTNPLTEIHQSYDQTNRFLSQTGQVVIAVGAAAIAIGTGGIGTGISGAILTAGATTAGTIATTSATNASMNADGNFLKQGESIVSTSVKDTTSKESLQQIAIAAAAAGLAQGAMQASGLSNSAKVVNTTNATNTTTSTIERVATNFSTGLQKAAIHSTSNIIATSAIKGQSINQTITEQGGGEKIFLNTALNALAETGAKEIGHLAHGFKTDSAGNILTNGSGEQLHQIDKATQLTLHGALGASISALRGNDNTAGILSGAAAGVIGEYAADSAYSNGVSANKSIAIGQAAGSLAALTTSIAVGASDEQTAKNIQIGNYIAGNAAANNTVSLQFHEVGTEEKDTSSVKDKSGQIKLGILGIKLGEINLGLFGEAKVGDGSVKISPEQTVKLESGSYHGSWLIVPENQELWKTHSSFKDNLTSDGKVYATIGGGPDQWRSEALKGWPDLHGGINRPNDVNLSTKILTLEIPPSKIGNEDAVIKKLLNLNENYETNLKSNKSDLNYWFFPNQNNSYYNSNSYAVGLGQAAELPVPQINLNAPGYDKPVPIEYFQKQ